MQHDARHRAADLISEVYAALLGNGTWQKFLDDLSGLLPNGKATLFYHDAASRSGAFTLNSQFDAASVAAYSRYYAARNPWMTKAVGRPLDLGVRAEQMLPRAELLRTEFYADYLRPQGLESAVGVTVFREHGCSFMLSVISGLAGDAEMQSAAALLERLAPHLRQAFTYYRRAGGVASGLVAVDAASDALGVAIVSVGFDRRVRWANAAGRDVIARGDPIGTNACGCITARHGEVREAIDVALGAAMRGDRAGKMTVTVSPADDARLFMRVTLVAPSQASCERYFAGACVVLLIETASDALLTEDTLRSSFALTPSEARLACAIAGGASVADAAARQGITRETARTHLKRVFAKMGVGRQAELVAKVHRCQRRC